MDLCALFAVIMINLSVVPSAAIDPHQLFNKSVNAILASSHRRLFAMKSGGCSLKSLSAFWWNARGTGRVDFIYLIYLDFIHHKTHQIRQFVLHQSSDKYFRRYRLGHDRWALHDMDNKLNDCNLFRVTVLLNQLINVQYILNYHKTICSPTIGIN